MWLLFVFYLCQQLLIVDKTYFDVSPSVSCQHCLSEHNPTNIYLLKVSNRNTRWRSEICSQSSQNNAIDVVLVSLLLTLNISHTLFSVSDVAFEQVKIWWQVYVKRLSFSYFGCRKAFNWKEAWKIMSGLLLVGHLFKAVYFARYQW